MPACRSCRSCGRILSLLLLAWGACAVEEKTCLLQVPRSNDNIQAHLAKSTFDISGHELPQGQPVQIIALDCGVLHGPANTLLAAKRAVGDGAMALNVDAVLSGGRLVTAHNATHRLRSSGFPTFACGNLSTTRCKLESELSPSCQYFKHYYLEAGAPASALLSMKFCGPQRFSFVEEFLEQFPKIPIIFDLKPETISSQREAMQILHKMLETSFPDRPSRLTTVRPFLPPNDLLEMLDTAHWDWPRFNLGVGVPKSSSQTDAWDIVPHLSDEILDHVSAIFLAPQQLEDTDERNLRAGIGLCSTADDMFLLGVTLRRSCSTCVFSEASMKEKKLIEVLLDQLKVHFPSAVQSFVKGEPAVGLSRGGLQLVGRGLVSNVGFGGFHLEGGWFLAHGGAGDFLGQNILVKLDRTHGVADKSSGVLATGIDPEFFA
eukprot:Skav212111  [mRNA]  locus=scaffold4272:22237:31047:+ [translate_table: standard]